MSVKPAPELGAYSTPNGPVISPRIVRLVNRCIEAHYRQTGGEPTLAASNATYSEEYQGRGDAPPVYQLPKRYCVYVIECVNRSDQKMAERLDREGVPTSSRYWKAYFKHGKPPYYIGWTKWPYRRLRQHTERRSQGANFTKWFPPLKLESINWYESEAAAKKAEAEVAHKIKREKDAFINPTMYHEIHSGSYAVKNSDWL